MDETKNTIFFDGYCSLCNGVVDFVISNKKETHTIYFSSLQSDYAIDFLAKHQKDANALETFFFCKDNVVYEKSTAALHVSKYLKKPYSFLSLLLIIPRWIRDPFYLLIAKNRYRLFGKKDSCRMPTKEEQSMFLG